MDSPWYSKYPKGIPQQIGPYEYDSLLDIFKVAAKKYPNRVAFENFGKQITFGEMDRLSTAFAAYLQQELQLKKGDRVFIQMPNLIQFPIAFMGVIKAGLIAVKLSPMDLQMFINNSFSTYKSPIAETTLKGFGKIALGINGVFPLVRSAHINIKNIKPAMASNTCWPDVSSPRNLNNHEDDITLNLIGTNIIKLIISMIYRILYLSRLKKGSENASIPFFRPMLA